MSTITHVPLPEWRCFWDALARGAESDRALAAPWLRDNEEGVWFSKSAWSLKAIAQFRKKVTGSDTVRVWLPGYFCNESLVPLRDMGAQISFYPVALDGVPDINSVREMLAGEKPDVIVLVHFFGNPVPATEMRSLANESKAWLVEDAAHVLVPVEGVGQTGDFVLYSPHKLLPVSDGALLLVRSGAGGGITNDLLLRGNFKGVCSALLADSSGAVTAPYKWLVKRVLQKFGIRRKQSVPMDFLEDVLPTHVSHFPDPKMTGLARRILSSKLGTLSKEAKARRENKRAWTNNLLSAGFAAGSARELEITGTAYLAGFAFDSPAVAEEKYIQLARAGLPVSTWPDLPPEVRADPVRHSAAIQMRRTRIFFPVHSSINPYKINSAFADVRGKNCTV